MEEQIYSIENADFYPSHIFDCGQCFRWKKQADEDYIGVFGNNVLNVKRQENKIIFKGICDGDIKQIVDYYFDMQTDYDKIKDVLRKKDQYLATSIEYGKGIRILNQDLWEMIISFIISANNNIPRIQKIIDNLSKEYGNEIIWNNNTYYTFPDPNSLKQASIEDLRKLGLGFRDKYIYETTKRICNGDIDLDKLNKIENTNEIKKILESMPGIGPKVADCIILFGMHRFNVFPVDVWVRRVMNELYIKNEDETKVKRQEIENFANKTYGDLQGLAQQYLFYWKRETA